MSVFSTTMAVPEGAPPDPTKHVNFSNGMVLGVADFKQEFAYLSGRDHAICRDLIGYGTVSGLKVSIDIDGARGPRVLITPGVAVTPRGELVRVGLAQCAYLNEWLAGADQAKRLQQRGTSSTTDRVDLYIALCYRSCPTDKVPIPGEPCRTEDEVTAPSRQMDDFKLELRWDAPEQPDEAAIRDFVDWLAHIPIVDAGSSLPLDAFLEEIRKAAFLIGSPPPSPPDFMYGTPPAPLRIARHDACRYLRAAFRLWVTELRPAWGASWGGAGPRCGDGRPPGQTQPEECLLLAHLDVPLERQSATAAGWVVSATAAVGIDEDARPFLAPLRLLQEWLWCGGARAGGGAGEGASIVAAGTVTIGAPASGPYKLEAATTGTAGEVKVTLAPFPPPAGFDYVVTAMPNSGVVKHPQVEFKSFVADGFLLVIKDSTVAVPVATLAAGVALMVQVTQHAT